MARNHCRERLKYGHLKARLSSIYRLFTFLTAIIYSEFYLKHHCHGAKFHGEIHIDRFTTGTGSIRSDTRKTTFASALNKSSNVLLAFFVVDQHFARLAKHINAIKHMSRRTALRYLKHWKTRSNNHNNAFENKTFD